MEHATPTMEHAAPTMEHATPTMEHAAPTMEHTPAALTAAGFLPALPRDLSLLFAHAAPARPQPLAAAPDTPLARALAAHARAALPAPTFHHSQRVFLLGAAVAGAHLAGVALAPDALFAAALLHDLGTVLGGSALSFEYAGGVRARELLRALGAPALLADSVCEAVLRHQDVGARGMLSALGAVLQAATLLDNTGRFGALVHADTVAAAVAAWPRLGWSGCFRGVIAREGARKPWCHSTVIGIEAFQAQVAGNALMNAYE